ncbi:replication-associated recombination protein A [Sulfobacillus harzensis]|uniref:Replication-associated recombination protein A n=1 Tax=Sulfobacillus harzensis TaxID=2729629 RepID=A0A7Y0L3P1_9FIRM|nr:replication-associated recombination protein A [Sulfobacillus harzensis]NMP22498.1 replication-associated recombination protein A [Sulfobacillus harzensis]
MPDDLFSDLGDERRREAAPLPSRLRPKTLDEVIGQEHVTGPGGLLRSMAEGRLRSSIFYGPPGTGKTTVAEILASAAHMAYVPLSAVATGIADVRKVADQAKSRWGLEGRGTVVFLDEIHRFSKSQQDVLLPFVEDGTFILLGATTENPWVSLNNALISRCLLVEFHALDSEAVERVLARAWDRRRAWWRDGTLEDEVLSQIAKRVGGDARMALTVLERLTVLADGRQTAHLTTAMLDQVWKDFAYYYDAHGDKHYDLASAFIKSIRGSDPDAALYWMGRMLKGGEDPRFIVRRVLIHAAEDVGLADPQALLVAHAASWALETVGLPEARIPIAEAVIYLAMAPKSNSVVEALAALDQALDRWPNAPVPDSIRDRHYNPRLKEPYRYPHSAPDHFLPDPHLPSDLEGLELYRPSTQGEEASLKPRLDEWRRRRREDKR